MYARGIPTLRFTYRPGILRIDCNENGFNASNVAAICGISQSTKAHRKNNEGLIGEKGIGFKSIFKAADIVWISSNEFTFKFDRTKSLGVITPLWEEFPEQKSNHGTSFLLQLSQTYDQQALIKELSEFDFNLLVFLRRIERIDIEVNCAGSDRLEKSIRKTQYQEENDRIIVLQNDSESLKYITKTHLVKGLPQEAKRRDVVETSIGLAFPFSVGEERGIVRTQNVYAFLPIRDYGFTFIVQADFILTASREDIETTLPWNARIRDELSEAFLSSMFHFNKGPLKYIWPYYLASLSSTTSEFFRPAVQEILSRLRNSSVFESCAGGNMRPSTLSHVPLDFCVDGEPFTLCDSTRNWYLSSSYPEWLIDAMKYVGLSQMTPRQFLEDLATLINTNPHSFHARSHEWHTQLAKVLIRLSTVAELTSLIQGLAIIPLDDGTWTAARDNNIFFRTSEASLAIPAGIRVLVVDNEAGSDKDRRTLLTSLGVKTWAAPEICQLILDVHASEDFQSEQLSPAELISHTEFLFHAKWQLPKNTDLWFVTTKGERSYGRKLYISAPQNADSAAGRAFRVLEKRFPVLHGDYLTSLPSEPEYLDWLINNLGLSKIPRMIMPLVEPQAQPVEIIKRGSPSSDEPRQPKSNLSGDSQVQPVELRIKRDKPSSDQLQKPTSSPFSDSICLQCTKRRTMCNKVLPSCSACRSHSVPCSYPTELEQNIPVPANGQDERNVSQEHTISLTQAPIPVVESSTQSLEPHYGDDKSSLDMMLDAKRNVAQNVDIHPKVTTIEITPPVAQPAGSLSRSIEATADQVDSDNVSISRTNEDREPSLPSKDLSCFQCRLDKVACNGAQPACDTCIMYQLQCKYPGGYVQPISVDASEKNGADTLQTPGMSSIRDSEPNIIMVRTSLSPRRGTGLFDRLTRRHKVRSDVLEEAQNLDEDYFPRQLSSESVRRESVNSEIDGRPTSQISYNAVPPVPSTSKSPVTPENPMEDGDDSGELLFDLSEEFKLMLSECDSADVLQLIRDNWHHYSKWVEGAHMKWQAQEYITASMHLKEQIGASLVQTIRGSLPLRETVLPKLDVQLDKSQVMPILRLHEPERTEWSLLSYFGVSGKTDVHYYLQNLVALIRDQSTDTDMVGYLYEQIQSRYTGQEKLIR